MHCGHFISREEEISHAFVCVYIYILVVVTREKALCKIAAVFVLSSAVVGVVAEERKKCPCFVALPPPWPLQYRNCCTLLYIRVGPGRSVVVRASRDAGI